MVDLARIQALVEDTLDSFDDRATSANLRRCLRIASLRGDYRNQLWLEMEAHDLEAVEPGEAAARRAEVLTGMPQEEADALAGEAVRPYLKRRTGSAVNPGKMFAGSVEQLEGRMRHLQQQAENFRTPTGLTPIDLALRLDHDSKARMDLHSAANETEQIIQRVSARLHVFLIDTEKPLDFGAVNASIFERTRAAVDDHLMMIAPEALDQFHSAYRRLQDGDPESLSHALTSCRRILKTVADQVHPATGEIIRGSDGRDRKLTEDKYINRLLQFAAQEVGKRGSGEVVTATLKALGERLAALDGLASKGVHDRVTTLEVDTCVIQTYLLLGELLRLCDPAHRGG